MEKEKAKQMFINWHTDELTSDMKCKYLYDNNLITDFIFKIVNDDNENVETSVIKCHKFLLSLTSDEFFNLIVKKNECELVIKDVHVNTFKTFINYIYTNEISVEMELLKDLLKLSHDFNIIPLKEICWKFVEDRITRNTIIKFFEYAIAYDNATILELCENFYQKYTEITLQTKEFLSINQNVLKKILSINNITCTKLDLLNAVVAWGNHQVLTKGTGMSSDSLRKEVNSFIPLIPIQEIPLKEFQVFCQTHRKLFTNEEICNYFLNILK